MSACPAIARVLVFVVAGACGCGDALSSAAVVPGGDGGEGRVRVFFDPDFGRQGETVSTRVRLPGDFVCEGAYPTRFESSEKDVELYTLRFDVHDEAADGGTRSVCDALMDLLIDPFAQPDEKELRFDLRSGDSALEAYGFFNVLRRLPQGLGVRE